MLDLDNIFHNKLGAPPGIHLVIAPNAQGVGAEVVSDTQIQVNPDTYLLPEPEAAFILAHELGHIAHRDLHIAMNICNKLIQTEHPGRISGLPFFLYHQKKQENNADAYGQELYLKSGYPASYFTNSLRRIQTNIHEFLHIPYWAHVKGSLNPLDGHYSMNDRYSLMVNRLGGASYG